MKNITVIVPIYRHWELMDAFFESMAAQTLCEDQWELIVVDNGSPSVPNENSLPDFVNLLVCTTPGSYAARNAGLQMAKGKLLLFTDADCRLQPNCLEQHWHAYLKHGDDCLNAGAVTVAKLTSGPPNYYELYDIFLGIPQERYATLRGYAVTANLGIPAAVFKRLTGFDETRFSGGDAEFCQRARRNGIGLRYLPEAEVLHPARSSWVELATKARRIKGGQICNGSLARRSGFFFKSFAYPFLGLWRVCRGSMPFSQKLKVMMVVVRLGLVEILEVFRLVFGNKPERR